MRTALAVALTIAAAVLVRSAVVRQFENRKPPTVIIAHEIGEGYCVVDDRAERGSVAVLSDELAGDCHAETVDAAARAKRRKTIIGIVDEPCARGQPCRLIMLETSKEKTQTPTAVLRK